MRTKSTGFHVDDLDSALLFYSEALPEPDENPAAQALKKAVYEQSIPIWTRSTNPAATLESERMKPCQATTQS